MSLDTKPTEKKPFLGVSRYELVTAGLTSALILIAALTAGMVTVRVSARSTDDRRPQPPEQSLAPLFDSHNDTELPTAMAGIESPENISADPSVIPDTSAAVEMADLATCLTDSGDGAADLSQESISGIVGMAAAWRNGFSIGTGYRRAGTDEQWWTIHHVRPSDLAAYVRQLQFLQVELAAFDPDEKTLTYLQPSLDPPGEVRVVTSGDDRRLLTSWAGGSLEEADIELFERAGVDVRGCRLMHFYSAESEQMLERMATEHAGRSPEDIVKSVFRVWTESDEVRIEVVTQTGRG